MNELISVIVPIYNVKPYLQECINSIMNQSYKNLEIILVDDGSKDGSGELCDEFEKKDNRIVVIHKNNGGLSEARNVGLNIATGEYFCFVDSDDTIEEDMIGLLYYNAKHYNADISMCCSNYIKCGKIYKRRSTGKIDIYYTKNNIIRFLFQKSGLSISVCVKMFRANKHFFKFPVGKTSEDAFAVLDTIADDSVLVIQDIGKYNYRLRDGSITRLKRYCYSLLDCYFAYKLNYKKIKNDFPECERVAARRLAWAIGRTLWILLNTSNYRDHKLKLKYLQRQLWLNRSLWINNRYCGISDKIICLLGMSSMRTYRVLRKIVESIRKR